ncbi:hypothetical protein SAMN05444521_7994 [Streptomyces sp. 3214.6]|nr:hypothetical protein SAMN05444521_7994 [Streptomyces sp. 3214.6]
MNKGSRVAAIALLSLGGLSLPAHSASAAAPSVDPGPVGGQLYQLANPINLVGTVTAPAFAQLQGMNINVGKLLG